MTIRLCVNRIGLLLYLNSVCLLIPVMIAFIYSEEEFNAFLITAIFSLFIGFLFRLFSITSNDFKFLKPSSWFKSSANQSSITSKTAFAIVGLSWVIIACIGAFPFLLSGVFTNFFDCLFESVSGFTTTGATVFDNVEILPRCILFWRSFTNFIGGLGVITLLLAVAPNIKSGSVRIMNAASVLSNDGKVNMRITEIPKTIYIIYAVLTITFIFLLLLGGVNIFEATCLAFSVAGTGGFSLKNNSAEIFVTPYIEIITSVFMMLFSINFILYWILLNKNKDSTLKNRIKELSIKDILTEEFRFFITIITISVIIIFANCYSDGFNKNIFSALRYSFFQVTSIISNTGFKVDYPYLMTTLSYAVLIILMFFGGMSGSSAGGVRNIRIILGFKSARREIQKILNPSVVKVVRMDGKTVDESLLASVNMFFFLFFLFTLACIFLLSICESIIGSNITITSIVKTAISTITNTGISEDIPFYSSSSKFVLSFFMLAGRLEIYPVLMLMSRSFWRR